MKMKELVEGGVCGEFAKNQLVGVRGGGEIPLFPQ